MHMGRVLPTPPEYATLMQSLMTMSWRRTMEGMISKEFLSLPTDDLLTGNCKLSPEQWARMFATRLLEATHGHWIYRNIVMHDHISGHVITRTKEQIVNEIERQQDLGGDGLSFQDQWMSELHLPHLDRTTGEKTTYWLLAIQAARRRYDMTDTQ